MNPNQFFPEQLTDFKETFHGHTMTNNEEKHGRVYDKVLNNDFYLAVNITMIVSIIS